MNRSSTVQGSSKSSGDRPKDIDTSQADSRQRVNSLGQTLVNYFNRLTRLRDDKEKAEQALNEDDSNQGQRQGSVGQQAPTEEIAANNNSKNQFLKSFEDRIQNTLETISGVVSKIRQLTNGSNDPSSSSMGEFANQGVQEVTESPEEGDFDAPESTLQKGNSASLGTRMGGFVPGDPTGLFGDIDVGNEYTSQLGGPTNVNENTPDIKNNANCLVTNVAMFGEIFRRYNMNPYDANNVIEMTRQRMGSPLNETIGSTFGEAMQGLRSMGIGARMGSAMDVLKRGMGLITANNGAHSILVRSVRQDPTTGEYKALIYDPIQGPMVVPASYVLSQAGAQAMVVG